MLRIGNGFDCHKFNNNTNNSNNNFFVLGGVKIKHTCSLEAHSDGDVLTHSIIDSLLGACSHSCDIGELFPDNNINYKNINSLELLAKTVKILKNKNFFILNIDNIIICESPKLSAYKTEIKNNLAQVLEIEAEKIGLKAKTAEKLGALGRQEGIAVFSTCLLCDFKLKNLLN